MGALLDKVKAKFAKKTYRTFKYDDSRPGCGEKAHLRFKQMKLTEWDVQHLFNAFNDAAHDRDVLERLQFHAFLLTDIPSDVHRERLFEIFCCGHNEGVLFDNFVARLWRYCACGQRTVCELAFKMFDLGDTGLLEPAEVTKMLQAVYGSKWKNLRVSAPALFKLLDSGDPAKPPAPLDLAAFRSIVKSNPMLMSTALAARRGLQRFGGEAYWQKQERLMGERGKGRLAAAFDDDDEPKSSSPTRRRNKRRHETETAVTHTLVEAFSVPETTSDDRCVRE